LPTHETETDVWVSPEEVRRVLAAKVAVDAGGIDIESARDIFGKSFIKVSHMRVGDWSSSLSWLSLLLLQSHNLHVLLCLMQEYLSRKPFDLFSLHLFQLVAKHRSFTQAAREAGLSLSALSRQMQSLEKRLGVNLLNRSTRNVDVTEAGQFLFGEATRLIGSVASTLEGVQAGFANARPVVRVGVSRSLSMAHMPGLFHAHQKRHPETAVKVSYHASAPILTAMDEHQLDIGVLGSPKALPETVQITHRFKDRFILIGPSSLPGIATASKRGDRLRSWITEQPWLMMDASTNTGAALRRWLKRQGLAVEPSIELDSFDLIISLVASGMGVALVPQRALALYRRKAAITLLRMTETFSRDIVVVTRKHRRVPAHVTQFVESLLF
jgi:DNA-binding transcriptional LysR family regulator